MTVAWVTFMDFLRVTSDDDVAVYLWKQANEHMNLSIPRGL
jgi:hypothetical protein